MKGREVQNGFIRGHTELEPGLKPVEKGFEECCKELGSTVSRKGLKGDANKYVATRRFRRNSKGRRSRWGWDFSWTQG